MSRDYRTLAQNSQRGGRSLQREVESHVFQWDVWIYVGSSTETVGSLRNPETRRSPPCVPDHICLSEVLKVPSASFHENDNNNKLFG